MATDVERLAVLIEANIKSYERAMKNIERKTNQTMGRATRSVRSLDSQMKAAAVQARNLMAAFGVTLGVGGILQLGRAVRGVVSDLAALGEAADKVGLTTDALQELRFAAEQTGVSQSTLDMAMQRFSRRVGEAINGTGELKDTLKQYNIALTDSEGRARPLIDVLRDYADAIKNASSQQERLRLAFKGFDSEGAALVNMLKDGAAGMSELTARLRELGGVVEEDGIRRAQEYDAILKQVSTTLSANFQRAVIDAAGWVSSFGDALDAVNITLDSWLDKLSGGDRLMRNLTGPSQRFRSVPAPAAPSPVNRAAKSDFVPVLPRIKPPVPAGFGAAGGGGGRLAGGGGGAVESFRAVNRELERTNALADRAGNTLVDVFDRMAFGGAKATDVMADLVRQFARMALQASLLGQGPLAQLFGTAATGGLLGGLGGGPTNIVPAGFAGAFAGGGHIPRGQFGLVGERGPELVRGPANVTPMGGDVQVNVINQGGGAVDHRERRGAGGMRIVDIVIGAVKDDMARGGFDGPMQGRFGARPVVAGRSGG